MIVTDKTRTVTEGRLTVAEIGPDHDVIDAALAAASEYAADPSTLRSGGAVSSSASRKPRDAWCASGTRRRIALVLPLEVRKLFLPARPA